MPIMDMVMEDWLKPKSIQERNIMMKWAQRARTIMGFAYFIMAITYSCAVFLPLFGISIAYSTGITDPNKLMPLQAYHIYNVTKSPQYELMYIGVSIVVFFAAITYTGIDNFLGLLVFHVCGQFDILKIRLMSLNKLAKFYDGLKNCVINHLRLLRAINVIEDTYNKMLLTIFLNFGILFAFYGLPLVSLFEEKNNVSMGRLMYLISIIINLFIHMGLYCAVGEILMTQSDSISYAVYDQEWYSLNPKEVKDLIFLMIRSEVPSHITAGKMVPLTMVTFCNLIKTSTGYISVLLTASLA